MEEKFITKTIKVEIIINKNNFNPDSFSCYNKHVAQWIRAPDSDSEGQGFESLHAYLRYLL